MSIIVSNISEDYGVEYSREGLQHYVVCLNRIPLSEFTHVAEDGMVICMQKAYESLKGVDIDQMIAKYERDRMYKVMEGLGI